MRFSSATMKNKYRTNGNPYLILHMIEKRADNAPFTFTQADVFPI